MRLSELPLADPVPLLSRRKLLQRCGMGFGMVGLAGMLGQDRLLAATVGDTPPHSRPRAKRVIHIFLNGGLSQVDSFDPKPVLTKNDGKPLPYRHPFTPFMTGHAMASPFRFRPCGECGTEVSELFPHIGGVVDELCLVRSMTTASPIHESALMLINCGSLSQLTPSMGSWLSYGLGSENENLPAFVVLCPGRGRVPVKGADNWRSAFLPPTHQGMLVDTAYRRVERLIENVRSKRSGPQQQRRQLDLVQQLNRQHAVQRGPDEALEGRIASYELAYRMQMAASGAFDVDREPAHIHALYGDSDHGRQMLIARRLAERGVRFVQVWHGPFQPWDSHNDIFPKIRRLAPECDRPIAALLLDLKQRGLLDETLVIVSGEFGRTPTVQMNEDGSSSKGRDHNSYGFSALLAGGGIRKGMVHGATDDFGYKAVQDPMDVHDLHATVLHQLGLDHQKLIYRHAGRDFRLTDVHGRVIHEILA